MKTRRVSSYRRGGAEYPQILLQGVWLRTAGYAPGMEFEVKQEGENLVIRPATSLSSLTYDSESQAHSVVDDGIGMADLEVALQLSKPRSPRRPLIHGPEDVARIFEPLHLNDRETFWSMYLDGRNRVSGIEKVSVGTLTTSLVHPREVYKGAVMSNSAAIIVVHNHPSGDPSPSKEDYEVTRRLRSAGKILGIRLIDHLVLGGGRYETVRIDD